MPTKDELMRIIEELLEQQPLASKTPASFLTSYKESLVSLLSRRIGTTLIEHMNDHDAERYLTLVAEDETGHAMELLQKALPNAPQLVEGAVSSFLAEVSYGRA